MRIPTSAIVMTVLLCVPFGLAMRDELRPAPVEPPPDELLAEPAQAIVAGQAQIAAAEELARARAKLLGTAPGQPGPALDHIAFGAAASPDQQSELARIEREDQLRAVATQDARGKLAQLELTLDSCDTLGTVIDATWGASNRWVAEDFDVPSSTGPWIDRAHRVRASFDPETCALRFESYPDAPTWVASIPLAAIGHPAEQLRDYITWADQDEAGFTWHELASTYDAYVKDGKLVGLSVSAELDTATTAAIKAELEKTYGPAKTDPDSGFLIWKRHPLIQLDVHAGQVMLQAGTLP